jgi:uncharacterized protein involved in type VI secretion and phage assembly
MGEEVRQHSSATFLVEVDGNVLPADVQALMSYAFVEDNLNLPDVFFLAFHDPDHLAVEKGRFKIASKVTVKVTSEAHPAGEQLIIGEVTAMEADFAGGRSRTIVRGFDRANRLYRGRRTRAFLDVKYSDIVRQVVEEAGLEAGVIDTPQGKPAKHVAQANMTDAEFLDAIAGEVGFVISVQDGKVSFRKPTPSGGAPQEGDLTASDPLQLVQGDNLLRFNAMITADSQVKEVTVRGWDITQKKAVVGTRPAETEVAKVGVSPAELAKAFGDRTFVATDVPYGDIEQVEAAAEALAEQIAGTHAQIEGVARGNPRLRAGRAVSLGTAGRPFDGKYTLNTTRHVYDNGEYLTEFASTGRHERSLQSMTSASAGGSGSAGWTSPAFVTAPIPGVVSGIVTNVKDDQGIGRAKVKIPRLDEEFESDWLRVLQPGAGKDRGALILPEVDDEVLVAFEHGDVRRGYVLGGVYNGQDKPYPPVTDPTVGSDGTVTRRTFTSRKGHFLVISDEDGDEHIQLATTDSKFSVKLCKDEEGGVILVGSDNLVRVNARGDITVRSDGKIDVEAVGAMSLKAQSIAVEAEASLSLKGQTVTVEGGTSTEVKAPRTKVAGSSMLDLDGGSTANLHAGVVRIN